MSQTQVSNSSLMFLISKVFPQLSKIPAAIRHMSRLKGTVLNEQSIQFFLTFPSVHGQNNMSSIISNQKNNPEISFAKIILQFILETVLNTYSHHNKTRCTVKPYALLGEQMLRYKK